MIRALIFDFDGTMVDTESLDFECWQKIYRSHACELEIADWAQCVGTVTDAFHPVLHLEKLTRRAVDGKELMAMHHAEFARRATQLPLLRGVEEWIRDAKILGLKLGVASSSQREWVHSHLSRHNLIGKFDAVRCAQDVQRVKPDPELYLAVAAAVRVKPQEAIAVEDSPNGLRAAKAAGLWTIAVPNSITCQMPQEKADLRLGSLAETTPHQVIKILEQN